MAKTKIKSIKWLDDLKDGDYQPAYSYLSLIYEGTRVSKILARFRRAPVSRFDAKDVFRAAQLPLLDASDSHVRKDRNRIRKKKALIPLLLVRDTANGKVIIADGYHRMCAVYGFDEDAVIYCKIV
jgi:disulfide oxidoreductase YuzD